MQYSTPNAAFVGAIASKLAGVKVRNYHIMGLRYEGFSGIKRKLFKSLEKLSCFLSTNIECVSNSVQAIAVKDGIFPETKSKVIWNGSTGGINLTRFNASKREEWRKEIRALHSLKDDEFVFGFVGRITRDKGINELLEAFFSFPSPAKLFLIGTPEGISTLNQELFNSAKNSERIIYIEHIIEIEKYYAAMDFLIFPSYREGFGMVVAEAAAMGTPAVISNIPGPIDVVIPGKTALICEVKNVDDLREKMLEAYNNRSHFSSVKELCVKHISQNFASNILNEKILKRKQELINNYYS